MQRAYASFLAFLIGICGSIGGTWLVRMLLDTSRLWSMALAGVLFLGFAVASFWWLRSTSSPTTEKRLWAAVRVEFLALGAAASMFAIVDFVDLFAGSRVPPGEVATVKRVVDGDTIIVTLDGKEERLRYVGVDAPESATPGHPVEPFGIEAAAFNESLVEGKTVYLEKDVSERDPFDRLLRYVRLEDGRMVNAELVRLGYAQAVTYPPDVKYAEEFVRLQEQARSQKRGLWALPY